MAENQAAADDQAGCTRHSIGDRINSLELRLTSLESTIVHRIEQESQMQDRTREMTVAQVAKEFKSELNSIENALRGHIVDQKDDLNKYHESIRDLHNRLDALLQKNERAYGEEFKAVHGRIDHVEHDMIPDLYNTVNAHAAEQRKDIKGLAKEFRDALKPIERITYMRVGAAGAVGGIVTAIFWAIIQLGLAYIKARYGAH